MEVLNRLEFTQAVLIGVALAVLYYFMMFDDGKRVVAQIDQTKKEYENQVVIKKKIEKALEDKRRFEQEAEEINTNLEAFLRYFPADSDQNKLMKDVSKAAEDQNVTVISLKPATQAPQFPNYPETAFSFEVEGTYFQVMRFVSDLTQMKRAIDFRGTEINVGKRGENPTLKFKATLIIFGRKIGDDGK